MLAKKETSERLGNWFAIVVVVALLCNKIRHDVLRTIFRVSMGIDLLVVGFSGRKLCESLLLLDLDTQNIVNYVDMSDEWVSLPMPFKSIVHVPGELRRRLRVRSSIRYLVVVLSLSPVYQIPISPSVCILYPQHYPAPWLSLLGQP